MRVPVVVVVCGVMCALWMVACEKRAPAGEADAAPGAAAPVEAPVAEAPVEAPRVEAPRVEVAAVEALVQAWLAAQNGGDFAAYSGLYAERFSGIKRVGAREFSYDRASWLKDRERMFSKAMVVSAEQLVITPSTSSATVSFTQTWASGTFKDVGTKQLVLTREGDALRIAREELLESQLTASDQQAKPLKPSEFGFVTMLGGKAALMVPELAMAEWAASSEATLLEWGSSAWVDANEERLPAALRELKGKRVVFSGPGGQVCQGQVTRFGIHGAAVAHFGERQRWSGDSGEEGEDALSDAQVAVAVMRTAEHGGLHVVALTDAPEASCQGALWGRAGDAPETSASFELSRDAGLMGKARLELERLKGYQDIQKSFTLEERSGPWHTFDGAPLMVRQAQLGGGRQLVLAEAQAGTGCGGFLGEFWALWELQAGGTWRLLSDAATPGDMPRLTAATDLDGDGAYELIGPEHIVRRAGPTWRVVEHIVPPYFDCPC